MVLLQENNKSNLLYKFAFAICNKDPVTNYSIFLMDHMPFGLEYQIEFFSCTNINQVCPYGKEILKECFITYPNTKKCVEKARHSRVLLTHFEVFGYVMKHSSECFILHLKQMRILGENWEESWVNLCKFFLTYPNSVSLLISFVFILWIINELKIFM